MDGFERGSRRRRTSTSNNVAAAAIAAASVATSSEGNVSLAATDTVPETKDPKPVKDVNDWICGICGLLESKDGSDLVLCEGNEETALSPYTFYFGDVKSCTMLICSTQQFPFSYSTYCFECSHVPAVLPPWLHGTAQHAGPHQRRGYLVLPRLPPRQP